MDEIVYEEDDLFFEEYALLVTASFVENLAFNHIKQLEEAARYMLHAKRG